MALLPLLTGCAALPRDEPQPSPTAPSGATLVETPLPPCSPEAAGLRDALPGSGVDFVHATPLPVESLDGSLFDGFLDIVAAGVVAADLDGDSAVDLFFPQTQGDDALYWGAGDGTFVRADPLGAGLVGGESHGIANAADWDGDGRLDLFVAGLRSVRLYRNVGERTFEDVAELVGITPPEGYAGGAAWSDFDRDGDLDLYFGGYVVEAAWEPPSWWARTSANRLFRNDGAAFTELPSALPRNPATEDDGAVLHAVWADFDLDGDSDLLSLHDFGEAVRDTALFENIGPVEDGWSFVDRAADASLLRLDAPMGALVQDLDGDSRLDLFISGFGPLSIRRGLGGFEFVDVSLSWAPTLRLDIDDASWSFVAIDVENDGADEVFVTMGPVPFLYPAHVPLHPRQGDLLLKVTSDEHGDFHFADRQDLLPTTQDAHSRGVAVGDLDDDGRPELVVGHVGEGPALLSPRCTAGKRVAVSLRDDRARNRFGVGAVITVESGGRAQARTVDAGGLGTYSGSGPVRYFGLGGREQIDRLAVRWPDGGEDSFGPLCADCAITVTRSVE
jgi:hypothetical protein